MPEFTVVADDDRDEYISTNIGACLTSSADSVAEATTRLAALPHVVFIVDTTKPGALMHESMLVYATDVDHETPARQQIDAWLRLVAADFMHDFVVTRAQRLMHAHRNVDELRRLIAEVIGYQALGMSDERIRATSAISALNRKR